MNRPEALNLAGKMHATWPRGGINADTWTEVLEDLQHGPAEAAYRHLRDTAEHQPSIAQLRTAYKAQFGTASEVRIDCPTCGGDGWATVHYEVYGLPNIGVVPCKCKAGEPADRVHRSIIAANNAEFDRVGAKAAPTRRIPA